MTTALSKFKQMANATNLDRAKAQAQKALTQSQTDPIHAVSYNIAVLLNDLKALPAAPYGVTFKGGVAGDKGSLSYTDTYHSRNNTAPCLQMEFAKGGRVATLTAYEGLGADEVPDVIYPCDEQSQALEVIAWFLGKVAPERETEIVPLLEKAERAMANQKQMENQAAGKVGRWTSRPVL